MLGVRSIRNAPLVVALVVIMSVGIMAPGAQSAVFFENMGYQVFCADTIIPRAHIYDSEDYQSMLLLPGNGVSLLLELASQSVYEFASEDLDLSEENPVLSNPESGLFVSTLITEEGSIHLKYLEMSFRVSPSPQFLGAATLEDVLSLKPAYALDARDYAPNTEALEMLKTVDQPVEIKVFFGTWCSSCKYLLPGFLRVIEDAGNPNLNVEYVGVDEDVFEPEDLLQHYSVSQTPTIIVLEGGHEIGRIEEAAVPTVEEELAAFLTKS